MNNRSARVLIDDSSQQVRRANERGDTHISMLTLDVVWLIDMANRGIKHEIDTELLQQLHGYVCDLCVRLGADPQAVPCDVWHLSELIDQLRSDRNLLANGWDLVGRNAREGWDQSFLDALDVARGRALYPVPQLLPLEARVEWAAAATEEERAEILKRHAKAPRL